MSIYNIKTIDLGKREEDSDYWVSDVNDAKIQEIATAIGMKVNVVTSGSRWILYRGDDIHNTTGWEFSMDSECRMKRETGVNPVRTRHCKRGVQGQKCH